MQTQSRQKKSRRSRARQLQLESLETRKLFAADISVVGNELILEGDTRDDYIEVRYDSKSTLSVVSQSGNEKLRKDFVSLDGISKIRLIGNGGNDRLVNSTKLFARHYGGHGNDTLIGGSGVDYLYGYYGADRLIGNAGNDVLYGSYDNDLLYGGSGHDYLSGSTGDDMLFGNDGNDRLYGGNGNDALSGHDGNDVMYGQNGRDSLLGHQGDDYLSGGAGNDRLSGGDGADSLHGDSGEDRLYGGDGEDFLSGGNHSDRLYGQGDADRLYGGAGNDVLHGDGGDDRLYGQDGQDLLDGGENHDYLSGGDGNDALYGGAGEDDLRGGEHNDYLDGGAGADDLRGLDGNDRLYGGSGHDRLFGGLGDDSLFGGITGIDEMWGESGSDRFLRFRSRFQNDPIRDYSGSQDAIIDFRNASADTIRAYGRTADLEAGQFTDAEILQIDVGLGVLQRRTGNTRLLKKANGDRMTMYRHGSLSAGDLEVGGFNRAGDIYMVDSSFSSEEFTKRVVVHEVGHNWDEASEAEAWTDQFRAISGWRRSGGINTVRSLDGEWVHNVFATFSSTTMVELRDEDGNVQTDSDGDPILVGYGRTNPKEDWATMWEEYFGIWEDSGSFGVVQSDLPTQNKLAVLDAFFGSLR